MTTATDILDASPLPKPGEVESCAELLILLVHRGTNWDVWGPRRLTYWDALTDRVKAATYAGNTLSAWWQDVTSRIDSHPRNAQDRKDAATALSHPEPRAVLKAMRDTTDVLVLRVRVAIEHDRETRPPLPGSPQ